MSTQLRRFLILLGLFGAGIVLVLLAASPVSAQGGGDDDQPPAQPGDGNNSYCAICHGKEEFEVTLGDGTLLDLHVAPETLAGSVHANIGCVGCHGENAFPHSGPTPADLRVFRIQAAQRCTTCHSSVPPDTAHQQAIAAGNTQAATCADCHGSHNIQPTANHTELVAAECGECHTDTFSEWSESPHVRLANEGCTLCHQSHGQQLLADDPTQLCMRCHRTVEGYIHEKHLESEFGVSCTSCHMLSDPVITLVSEEEGGANHRMIAQTRACNECHRQLEESGQWAALDADPALVAERDELQQQVNALQQQLAEQPAAEPAQEPETTGLSYVEVLLALVLGLVAGGAAMLVLLQREKAANGEE